MTAALTHDLHVPCQYCMSGSTLGAQQAQLVLHEGRWQPWPLVGTRPSGAPRLLTSICPVCDRERFNAEAVPRLNAEIARATGENHD